MNILTKFALSAGDINIPTTSADTLFTNILNVVYYATGLAAVSVIIIAGFTMVISGNNPSSVAKARMAILYSVIGIVVILSAFVITNYVIGKF
jgi:hypothetical protein